jgi:hypothetical protein
MAPSPSGGKTANLQAVIDALAAHGVELDADSIRLTPKPRRR